MKFSGFEINFCGEHGEDYPYPTPGLDLEIIHDHDGVSGKISLHFDPEEGEKLLLEVEKFVTIARWMS